MTPLDVVFTFSGGWAKIAKLGDEDIERILALTLESRPDDATHWSTRSMAAKTGFSRASIHRIWRAFSLAPHRSETFKLSRDPSTMSSQADVADSGGDDQGLGREGYSR